MRRKWSNTKAGVKRWEPDKWLSLCVRHAADNICEHCKRAEATDCSHIYGRADFTVRWCKENTNALCRNCHDHFGQHGMEYADWVDSLWPKRRQLLLVKRRGTIKNNASTRADASLHYRTEYRRMLDTGDNEFSSWN